MLQYPDLHSFDAIPGIVPIRRMQPILCVITCKMASAAPDFLVVNPEDRPSPYWRTSVDGVAKQRGLKTPRCLEMPKRRRSQLRSLARLAKLCCRLSVGRRRHIFVVRSRRLSPMAANCLCEWCPPGHLLQLVVL